GIAGVKGDELGMSDMRGCWKRPVWSARNRAQCGKLIPMLPEVLTAKQVGRLGASIKTDSTVHDVRSQAVNVVNRDAIVSPLPSWPAGRTRVDRAKERAGKHQAAGPLKNN